MHPTMESAIKREKAMKAWKRVWKLELVERENRDWRDLHSEIIGGAASGE
jgi:putative endonuclease